MDNRKAVLVVLFTIYAAISFIEVLGLTTIIISAISLEIQGNKVDAVGIAYYISTNWDAKFKMFIALGVATYILCVACFGLLCYYGDMILGDICDRIDTRNNTRRHKAEISTINGTRGGF